MLLKKQTSKNLIHLAEGGKARVCYYSLNIPLPLMVQTYQYHWQVNFARIVPCCVVAKGVWFLTILLKSGFRFLSGGNR